MKDVELAKKLLVEKGLTIAVVKYGKLIYKSQEKGIKPMYILATEMRDNTKGVSIADRVIGKGAAILCRYIGAKKVYGKLMSNAAVDVLKEGNIAYSYDEICDYIKNRDNTDLCPIEKMAIESEDVNVLLDRIGEFCNIL